MKKRLAAILVVCTMIFSTGCTVNVNVNGNNNEKDIINEDEKPAEDVSNPAAGGSPWVDSDIKENITEDMPVDPKDDFHLYANKDWLTANDIPDGYYSWSHYAERGLEVKKQCIELLKDDSLSGHDADLIQTYNKLVLDWDARNASGVSEIRELCDRINAAADIEDITDLLTDSEVCGKLYPFIEVGVDLGFNDPELYLPYVATPTLILGDSAEYNDRTEYGDMNYGYSKDLFVYMAGKMGMTEAEKCFDNAIDLEKKLAAKIYTTKETHSDDYLELINNEMAYSDTVSLAKVFPLEDIISAQGYKYDGIYIVERPDYFEALDEIYVDKNSESIKDLILVNYLLGYSSRLDKDTYDKMNELDSKYFGTNGTLPDEEMAYNLVSRKLPASMQKVYIAKYGSEEDRRRMEELCRQVIDSYREMLSANQWASDEVKAYAIEKLDKIEINAAYPDKFRDTSNIDISGCSLIEADEVIDRIGREYNISLIGTRLDREMWAEVGDILRCNAFYDPVKNTINMIIGMMGEPFYSPDMSTEELYASIGAFWVGHEISHAFDSSGSQFDAEGKMRDWWTPEDKAEFKRRVSKLDDYLDGIAAFGDKHFIGTNIDTEMVADITGLQCALNMASKIDGFDYDKFFTKYAQMNVSLALYSEELSMLMQNEHPLDYSRTNVPVQQFEEFYETYGVKEGDNMYLAPEDRLTVW